MMTFYSSRLAKEKEIKRLRKNARICLKEKNQLVELSWGIDKELLEIQDASQKERLLAEQVTLTEKIASNQYSKIQQQIEQLETSLNGYSTVKSDSPSHRL
jgi:hypothetical protein